jgi:hypothetical protein
MKMGEREIAEILFTFDELWCGWESDDKAWIVRFTDGRKAVIETNHGTPFISCPGSLRNKIKEYEYAITETQRAIEMVEGGS